MDILVYGGQVTLIGLLVVFAALFILILCIVLMGKIFTFATREKAPKAQPAPAVVQPVAQPVIEEAPAEEGEVEDPNIIAVIASAIAAFDSNKNLVVRSVRRSPGWKRAARNEQVAKF